MMPLENEQIFPFLLGIGVFAALLIWAAYSHTWRWRSVAAAYPRPDTLPVARGKVHETIVITSNPKPALVEREVKRYAIVDVPWRVYVGVMLTVVDEGLLLSRVFPFNFMCPPVYLPFAGMSISPTYWAVWPEPVAIRMKLLPDIDIILGQKAAQWLREHMT